MIAEDAMEVLAKGDPRRSLRDAVSGLRTVGTVFAAMGLLFDGPFLLNPSIRTFSDLLSLGAARYS